MAQLDECTLLKIRSIIARLDAYITRLEEKYKYIYENRVLIETDCLKRQMYLNEMNEIRKIAKELMLIQATLELMHGQQKINAEVLVELERMIKSLMPEVAIELNELESFAEKADEDKKIIEESIAIADERMKFWGC